MNPEIKFGKVGEYSPTVSLRHFYYRPLNTVDGPILDVYITPKCIELTDALLDVMYNKCVPPTVWYEKIHTGLRLGFPDVDTVKHFVSGLIDHDYEISEVVKLLI